MLTGIRRSSAAGAEAAFNEDFLLGACSSAFFFDGVAFAFAFAGSTRLEEIGAGPVVAGPRTAPTMAILGVGLLAGRLRVQVSAVPFHMWTPDAYEGAPTIVTAFMSTGVKAAAFGAFVRVFLSPLEPLQGSGFRCWSVIAAATMIVGRRRGRPDQHQADARLLEHRACRLSARSASCREQRREGGGAVLPAVLRGGEPRRPGHRRAARHPRTSTTSCEISPG